MMQFFADQIDQMDLALDQLAMHDRNFDRFALMLIDNVVELSLHNYAKDRSYENDMWGRFSEPRNDPKLVAAALGQRFDSKIKLARSTKFLSDAVCNSIQYLHSFRNTAYHRGLRHDGILHSLALFYFKNACVVLANHSPMVWSSGSRDRISHRAAKYLGKIGLMAPKSAFDAAWERLRQVADTMSDSMISDLHSDMKETIERTNSSLDFLTENDFGEQKDRSAIVISCQAWPFAFTDAGKKYAVENRGPTSTIQDHVEWISSNYPWPIKSDPIPGWLKRLDSLKLEKDPHIALKKYCDFLNQTEEIRSSINEAEYQLDSHIQQLVDEARGK